MQPSGGDSRVATWQYENIVPLQQRNRENRRKERKDGAMLPLLDPVISFMVQWWLLPLRWYVCEWHLTVVSSMDSKSLIAHAQSLAWKTLESGLGARACALSSSRRFWNWDRSPGWLSCPPSRSQLQHNPSLAQAQSFHFKTENWHRVKHCLRVACLSPWPSSAASPGALHTLSHNGGQNQLF